MQRQSNADTAAPDSKQFAEDPRRSPVEKETAIYMDGEATHFEITSFRKVVFAKLFHRPAFQIKSLYLLGEDGQYRTVDSRNKITDSDTVIGLVGRLPVGALTVGTPRTSNSHADIVK